WLAPPRARSGHHARGHARHPPAPDARSRRRRARPWASVILVVPNGLVNLLAVLFIVVPGGVQFGLTQRRLIIFEKLFVAQAKLPGLNQHPNGDSAIANACIAAKNARRFSNDRREGSMTVLGH